MQKSAWTATLATLAVMPAAAQTSFPEELGTWKGESESIVADSGNSHHPGSPQSGNTADQHYLYADNRSAGRTSLFWHILIGAGNRIDYRRHIAYRRASFHGH
jgi:hypothetical protein